LEENKLTGKELVAVKTPLKVDISLFKRKRPFFAFETTCSRLK